MALTIPSDKVQPGSLHYATIIPLAILLLAIGATAFFLIYASVTTNKGLAFYNQPVLEWMMAHRNASLTIFMQGITTIFSPIGAAIVTGAIVLLWVVRGREIWRPILLTGAMGTMYITSIYLKNYVHHTRPPIGSMIAPYETDFSFPSGHTIGIAVALFVIGYLICSRAHRISLVIIWSIVSILGVVLIAFSRLYLGYHWLSDVTASLALAFIILAVTIFIDSIVTKLKH